MPCSHSDDDFPHGDSLHLVDEGLGKVLETFDDVLVRRDLALVAPRRQLVHGLLLALRVPVKVEPSDRQLL